MFFLLFSKLVNLRVVLSMQAIKSLQLHKMVTVSLLIYIGLSKATGKQGYKMFIRISFFILLISLLLWWLN